jgi:arabinofuranan 3-O-arabinosyltransferase
VPAGEQGSITLSFPSNRAYRIGLTAGLCPLPLLLLMALVGARRPVAVLPPTRPWRPGLLGVAGLLAAGMLIAGPAGLAIFGAALGAAHLMRRDRVDRITLFTVPVGLILAGALLSRYPWRSVDGYIGHSAWVQLPALIGIAALAASLFPPAGPARGRSRRRVEK